MRLPSIEDRTIVIGRTGSGKTYFGLWLLSEMPIEDMPWIVFDFKRDVNIMEIPYHQEIPIGYIPTMPGVYVVRPMPTDDLTDYLYAIWNETGIGLFIDEAMMLSRNSGMMAILIQGRSKHIPVIACTQRPVGVASEYFTEASFFDVFPTHDKREQKRISEFTTLFQNKDIDYVNIREFNSWWFDVKSRKLERLSPVPPMNKILQTFRVKLQPETEETPVPALSGGDQRRGFKLF